MGRGGDGNGRRGGGGREAQRGGRRCVIAQPTETRAAVFAGPGEELMRQTEQAGGLDAWIGCLGTLQTGHGNGGDPTEKASNSGGIGGLSCPAKPPAPDVVPMKPQPPRDKLWGFVIAEGPGPANSGQLLSPMRPCPPRLNIDTKRRLTSHLSNPSPKDLLILCETE